MHPRIPNPATHGNDNRAIYVLSPLDLLPEVVLGPLGLPDDIIAAVVALSTVVAALRARPDRDT